MTSPLEGALLLPALPPPVSWWPPAQGWIALTATLALLLILAPLALMLNRRRQRRRLKAQRILWEIPEDLSDHDWLAALNTQLKRHLKSRGEIAATRLYGSSWVDYLCQHYPRPRAEVLAPLGGTLYQADVHLSVTERRTLQRELLRWIRHNHV